MHDTAPLNGKTEMGICKRCSINTANLKVRQDSLCTECFIKYVNTKVVKRMEAFRVRSLAPGQTRKLLLPLSLGISSVTLLHILDNHLEGQLTKSGRAGYTLHVVHIASDDEANLSDEVLLPFKNRFPQHEYSVIRSSPSSNTTATNETCNASNNQDTPLDLSSLLASVSSPSSRKDVELVHLRNRLVASATDLDCEGIIWGDTTTSLAEKVLAETAKGRGSNLPWLTNDGESPLGVPFYFPMKDLLRKELPAFAQAVGLVPDLVNLSKNTVAAPTSGKNASIDGLMKEYFESVEENYPSIVTNVVRTSSKLRAPSIAASDQRCQFCHMPINSHNVDVNPEESVLCHGCRQSLLTPT